MKKKKELQEKLASLRKEHGEQLQRLAAAQQGLIGDEQKAFDERETAILAVDEELKGIERLEEAAKRNAAALGEGRTRGARVHDLAGDKPYERFGEFLRDVVLAASPGGAISQRLYQFAPSGSSEAVPSDGGFLVSSQWSNQIFEKMRSESQVAGRCRQITIGENNNGLSLPYVDETSRATGSRWGGVRVYRTNEADTPTASKPKIGRMEIKLEKLMGLWYATDELITDATAMESIAVQAFGEEFAFVLDDEIVRGDGAGKCLGILNAAATVTVAKEAGPQTADTVVFANVNKMYQAMPARLRAGAVWLINQDVEPQLETMVAPGGIGTPVWLPAGGLADAPLARLKGRPVIPIEQASAIGDLGDIMFVNLDQYLLISKGGLNQASSMHVRFIYDEMTFRWTYRVNGQPGWKSSIAPYKGATTMSPFVILEAR